MLRMRLSAERMMRAVLMRAGSVSERDTHTYAHTQGHTQCPFSEGHRAYFTSSHYSVLLLFSGRVLYLHEAPPQLLVLARVRMHGGHDAHFHLYSVIFSPFLIIID